MVMLWFFSCIALLVVGYFTYGKFVERVFGIQPQRPTPAIAQADGVDYVEMSTPKVYLIHLLNIAGLGPIFGPILGALYGPAAMLWIVFGCIFAGAVHDYFSGMLSVRNGGAAIPNVVGRYLGQHAKLFMNGFAIILLMLVGVVFVASPADLLARVTGFDAAVLVGVIFAYYVIGTLLPVDKIIGRIYPVFGILLVVMSVIMVATLIFADGYSLLPGFEMAQLTQNLNPEQMPLWPGLFITIACGAISGFHATQSPMMARCMKNEKYGRSVFYGAMIGEGVIALIWCAVALSLFGGVEGLQQGLAGNPANLVFEASNTLLGGGILGMLAIVAVVVLPVTSGEAAFRSARLILADFFKLSQTTLMRRLMIALPMFAIGAALTQIDFGIIWRYFGWANQVTAAIMLWTASSYLKQEGKLHWITTIPALFMTTVVITYILNNDSLGLGMSITPATGLGFLGAVVAGALLLGSFGRTTKQPVTVSSVTVS